jgi:hypothetical protein
MRCHPCVKRAHFGGAFTWLSGNYNDATFLVHLDTRHFDTRSNGTLYGGSNVALSDAHAARPIILLESSCRRGISVPYYTCLTFSEQCSQETYAML